MWNDNETDVDLLGFDQLVDAAVTLVETDELLPLTIGAFGDWGSGKSSLMKMVEQRIAATPGYVCVSFSPWQQEDYADVKASLMVAVMAALHAEQSVVDKLRGAGADATRRRWDNLLSRVNWFRVAGFALKGVVATAAATGGDPMAIPLAVGSVGDLAQSLTAEGVGQAVERAEMLGQQVLDKEPTSEREPVEQSIGEFRRDFRDLLNDLDVRVLVVFIDDLDRCLPANIIDTLEAIRLFLAVPKTAFVIGADERIVRHAIATRYPEMLGQALSIGRDYLEKMVQIPLRIAPMTETETETYLNLLGCKLHLDELKYTELVDIAQRNRVGQTGAGLGVAMNYGVAISALGESIPPGLIAHMELVGRIAPTLCGGTEGNPRQIKRFMNTLLLRQRLAAARSITLDAPVLAKLMLLEYFHEPSFRELFRWQTEPGGAAARLVQLESALAKGGDPPKTLPAELKAWIDDSALRDWLLLDPMLGQVDLAPYLYFSRDRALTQTAPSRRLSQQLQQLLGQLLSDTAAVRAAGTKTATTMGVDEFRPVYEQLLDRFTRNPRALNGNLGTLIVSLAADKRDLIPSLASALRAAPPTAVTSTVPVTITTAFGVKQQLPPDLKAVVEEWKRQTVNAGLAKAAEVALRPTRAR